MKYAKSKLRGTVSGYTGLIIWTIFCLFPLTTMLLIALKPRDAFMSFPPDYFSLKLTLENFLTVLKNPQWLRYYGNSIIIATVASLISVTIGSLAAFSFAKHKFAMKEFLIVFILALQMIPAAAIMIPLYTMFANIKLLDTFVVLILVNSVETMPLVIWLMRGYFATIPRELEEAAFIDGCSRLRAFRLITFPLAAPGIAASAIYAFVRSFNEYILARTLAGNKVVTYTVGLKYFSDQYEGIDMTLVSAAALTALIPVIVMFGLFHKYFVIGLTGGAVKG